MSGGRVDDMLNTARLHTAPLHAASLRMLLSAPTGARLVALDIVDTLDSTNSELLRRRTPDAGIAALFAERQTGGRGRHGRAWASPPGSNLYLSLARCFSGDFARLGGLSLVVGIAVAEAMHALGAHAVRVKWPNDLVVESAGALRGQRLQKLGGVLIEGGLQDGRPRAVIGVGLNVRMPDAVDIDQPWTDLHALLGTALPSRTAIAAAMLAAVIEAIDRFDAEGLSPFLPHFDALDALRDAALNARIGDAMHAGVAAGLAEDGALRLRTAAGEIRLRAGEVTVRASVPAQA